MLPSKARLIAIRAYVVTFVFATFRVLSEDAPDLPLGARDERRVLVSCFCLAVPWFIEEVILQSGRFQACS